MEDVFLQNKIEYIFHLAAQINLRFSVESPIEDMETNIKGSLKLLELAKKHKINKFIFPGISAVNAFNDRYFIP